MEGFNISAKVGGKTLLGRTQDDFNISAVTKESITKDDRGNTRRRVTGHDVSLSMSAIYSVNTATGTTTQLDRDEVLKMALLTGDAARVAIEYGPDSGGDVYTGYAVITGYKESSNATDEATISIDLSVDGALTKKAK